MQRKGWSPPKLHSQITPQLTPSVLTVKVVSATLGLRGAVVVLWVQTWLVPESLGTWLCICSAAFVPCCALTSLPAYLLSPTWCCCHMRIVFQQWLFSSTGDAPNAPGRCQSRVSTCAGPWDPRHGLAKLKSCWQGEYGKWITVPCNFYHGMKYLGYMT